MAQKIGVRVVNPSHVDRAWELLALLDKIARRLNAKITAFQVLCPLLPIPVLTLLIPEGMFFDLLPAHTDLPRVALVLAAVVILALIAVAGLAVKRSSRAAADLEYELRKLTDGAQLGPLGSFVIPKAGLSDALAWEAVPLNRKERSAQAEANRARAALREFNNKVLSKSQQAQRGVLEQQLSRAEDRRAAARRAIAELLSSSQSHRL